MSFNLPPGILPKDTDGGPTPECLYCFQVATRNINGSPFCEWHYEQEMSDKEWIEENENNKPK